jgi:8-oxo-dGTP pyrophosphatase MutT (NUDIX family)
MFYLHITMKILEKTQLYKAVKGNKTFLTLWKVIFNHNNKDREYFMVSRGETLVPHENKKPDAVVIIATMDAFDADGKIIESETRLVLTDEFRVPIGCREIGFPAGLIDDKDYTDGASIEDAAKNAAVREFKEETGLDLEVTSLSPVNLYSSAGMTNESITYVFGKASSVPNISNLEDSEDIVTILATRAYVQNMLYSKTLAFGKTAWPFLWAFSKNAL